MTSRRDVASGPGGAQPARPSPPRARRSLGRLVATPTFAAGACIVLAAALAYGTARTHLAFRGPGPACATASCSTARPGAAGVPMRSSARPERARSGAPGGPDANRYPPGRAGPGVDANSRPGRLAGNASSVAASPRLPVVIAYRILRVGPGGFVAAMTIANHSRFALRNWLLFVRYRRARMERVWGARWYPARPHAARAGVVAPWPARPVLWPGARAELTLRASGHPGPPAGCFFDTARCRFRRPGG